MSTVTRPEPRTPRRIEALATLPVFFKLEGKRALLAGGTDGAVWKAELLLAAGAALTILADGHADAFASLAAGHPERNITITDRRWDPADLPGAAIAIADIEDEDEAKAFAAAARAAGVPVNVVDKPALCDFAFGSIVNRSPLVISISTDGAAPVFGQAIRAKIEALLPSGFKRWAQAAKDWRTDVQAREWAFRARRSFWELFSTLALREPNRAPSKVDREALLAETGKLGAQGSSLGRVSLVGAGPGDPELLTLKAVRTLQSADIVLYDNLVSDEVLDFARREAKRMLVGKKGHGPSCKQDEINALMLRFARQGLHVVRLKSGDPGIFGRAGEEIAACREAGIPVEIVPGISAAQGAAAALGVSLTHRDHARRLQFITGHARDGQLPDDIAWEAVADRNVTTVVYMPKHTLPALRERALAAGLDPQTPAIAVASATTARERHVSGTIASLPDLLSQEALDGPVLVLIGAALSEAATLRLDVEPQPAAAFPFASAS